MHQIGSTNARLTGAMVKIQRDRYVKFNVSNAMAEMQCQTCQIYPIWQRVVQKTICRQHATLFSAKLDL